MDAVITESKSSGLQATRVKLSMASQVRFGHAILVAVVVAQVFSEATVLKEATLLPRNFPVSERKCECGVAGNTPRVKRIVNDQTTNPHQFPWMAAILQGGRWNCGGTLVNDKYVLTAGHCVDRYDKSFYSVLLGKHRLFTFDDNGEKVFTADEDGSMELGVSALVFRPDFETIVMEPADLDNGFEVNDVALVRLDAPVEFSSTIRPICLPVDDANDYVNTMAVVTGWGRLRSGERPDLLRRGVVRVLADAVCVTTPLQPYFKPGMMCADANPSAACRGDSGGPLIREKRSGVFELIGVVSWGIGCAETAPGVYSRVTHYLQWLRDNMRDAEQCKD